MRSWIWYVALVLAMGAAGCTQTGVVGRTVDGGAADAGDGGVAADSGPEEVGCSQSCVILAECFSEEEAFTQCLSSCRTPSLATAIRRCAAGREGCVLPEGCGPDARDE
ncbi:MAG: hypothetical protein AB8I08_35645 [Sandaracinaceae bacterium]